MWIHHCCIRTRVVRYHFNKIFSSYSTMGRLSIAFVALLVLLFVCSHAHGQLNFSTGWGKRGLGSGTSSVTGGESSNCKASVDSLMIIYKLIQNEAQKLIECEKFTN